ncbi:MAG: hypothetical protein HN370_05995 [Phycisphaerales bacterium]|jgi:Flp pilus assembly pilin Flp|nr:hypothetical protein [Phycisphaerales bacterium]
MNQPIHRDEQGASSIEYILLLAFFGVPMISIATLILNLISGLYHQITCLHSLLLP